jgi:hypothetical protein
VSSTILSINFQKYKYNKCIVVAQKSESYAIAAGLPTNMNLSTADLWHFPAIITNTSIATPILNFMPDSGNEIPVVTVAAALIQIDGRQQLSIFVEPGMWSITTRKLASLWVTWGTSSESSLPSQTVRQHVLVLTKRK